MEMLTPVGAVEANTVSFISLSNIILGEKLRIHPFLCLFSQLQSVI